MNWNKIFWRRALPWVLPIFVAIGFSVGLMACSANDEVAGVSTVETENAYIVQVLDEEGAPVANAVARMRSADYLPELNATLAKETAEVYYNPADTVQVISPLSTCYPNQKICVYKSDSLGFIFLDSLFADSVTLEILDGVRGLFTTLVADEIQKGDSVELTINPYGVMEGKVDLPEGETFAWVQIYGSDRKTKTDSLGNFDFGELAPGDYRIRIVVGDSVIEEKRSVVSYSGEKFSDSSVTVSSSSDGAECSSSTASLGYLNVLDFENGLGSVYLKPTDTTVVMYPAEDGASMAIVDAGLGREGKAFHWTTSAGLGSWSFMGLWMCSSSNPCDFSGVDSIEYYVRGTGSYSFNLESIIEGSTGKAVFLDTLNGSDEWERVVVRSSDFMEGDSTYGNMGWDFVSKQVTNIAVPAYYDAEIWIDDIRFYGVDEKDLE